MFSCVWAVRVHELAAGGLDRPAVGGEGQRITRLPAGCPLLNRQAVAGRSDHQWLGTDVHIHRAVALIDGLDIDQLRELLDGRVALIEQLVVLPTGALAGGDLLIQGRDLLRKLGRVGGQRVELAADAGLHRIKLRAKAVEILRSDCPS